MQISGWVRVEKGKKKKVDLWGSVESGVLRLYENRYYGKETYLVDLFSDPHSVSVDEKGEFVTLSFPSKEKIVLSGVVKKGEKKGARWLWPSFLVRLSELQKQAQKGEKKVIGLLASVHCVAPVAIVGMHTSTWCLHADGVVREWVLLSGLIFVFCFFCFVF